MAERNLGMTMPGKIHRALWNPSRVWPRLKPVLLATYYKVKYRYLYRLKVTFGQRLKVGGKLILRGEGRIVFGDDVWIDSHAKPTILATGGPDSELLIGDRVYLNGPTIVATTRITLGEDCLIGDATIIDTDFHSVEINRRSPEAIVKSAPVTIGRNVWVAGQAGVLKGVTIGENSVVGFRSVVTRKVPSNVLIVGNPGRIVRGIGCHEGEPRLSPDEM